MMYGSTSMRLKGLSIEECDNLSRLAFAYGELYNRTLEVILEQVNRYGGLPFYGTLFNKIKCTLEYMALGPAYRHAVGQALDNCRCSVLKKSPLPKVRPRCIGTVLREFCIEGGKIKIPATEKTFEMWLPLPDFIAGKEMQFVAICPRQGGEIWELVTCYKEQEPPLKRAGECVGIDLGIGNFATLACSNGQTLIIDGGRLKSILRADYRRQKTQFYTKMDSVRRWNRVDDYVCKAAAIILEFCRVNHVGKVLIGQGDTVSKARMKQRVHTLWPDYPLTRIKDRIIAKCKREGIWVQVVDESWTSKASFLDNDPIPSLYDRTPHQFSGTRRKRGLYVSKSGRDINADVNGALNILRKHKACCLSHLQKEPWLIQSPKRVDPLNDKPNGLPGWTVYGLACP